MLGQTEREQVNGWVWGIHADFKVDELLAASHQEVKVLVTKVKTQLLTGLCVSQVQRVDELLDANNYNVNHLVEPGDYLEAFNGLSVEDLAIRCVSLFAFSSHARACPITVPLKISSLDGSFLEVLDGLAIKR